MPGRSVRAAIVGASSLVGKELAEQLNASASLLWDISLLDSGDATGQLTAAGDEALLVQPIEPTSFAGLDVVFFAGEADTARTFWKSAAKAGASIVDMTGALDNQPGMTVRCPWIKAVDGGETPALDLSTVGVVSAHPAAVMLGVVLARLRERFQGVHAAATVLEPASQYGSAGLDEMHAQIVSLLSFKSFPQDVFDVQVAFNLNASLGGASRISLATTSQRVREHLQRIAGVEAARNCAMQWIQAPVFNGYTASVFVTLEGVAEAADVERALAGGIVSLAGPDDASPSNQGATEQDQVLLQVQAEPSGAGNGAGFWLWMAADNLRLAARNAAACAAELIALRPSDRVQ